MSINANAILAADRQYALYKQGKACTGAPQPANPPKDNASTHYRELVRIIESKSPPSDKRRASK